MDELKSWRSPTKRAEILFPSNINGPIIPDEGGSDKVVQKASNPVVTRKGGKLIT